MDDVTGPSMVLPVNRLTPYLRLRIDTGERSIMIRDRHSLFGFIPLRRRSIEFPFSELRSHHIKTVVRFDSLTLIAALIAGIFVLSPPVAVTVVLAVAAVLQVPFAAPNAAVQIERADGWTWMIRFCRDYAFDVDLALSDAEHRRGAQPTSDGAAA